MDVDGFDADARLHHGLEIRAGVQNLTGDNVPARGIDDRTVADQIDQFLALVTKGPKIILRFAEHQLATGAAQDFFGELDAHGTRKAHFSFCSHQYLTAGCRVFSRSRRRAISWLRRSNLCVGRDARYFPETPCPSADSRKR